MGITPGLPPSAASAAGPVWGHANLAALLASRLVALEHAPAVTTAFAFVVHLLPVWLIACGVSLLWTTPLRTLFAVAVYLFAPIHPEESWMNSINAMSYLGVASVVILTQDVERLSRRMFVAQGVLLFCGGLSGVYTAFLAPAFLLKWLALGGRRNLAHLAAVASASAIQAAVVVAVALSAGVAGNRLGASVLPVRYAAGVLEFMVFEAFLAEQLGRQLMEWLGLRVFLDRPGAARDSGVLVWALLVAVLAAITAASRHRLRWILLVAFVCEATLSSLGAMGGLANKRYAIVPQFTLLLLALSVAWSARPTVPARVFQAATLGAVLASFHFGEANRAGYAQWRYGRGAPMWAQEVARWRADPAYVLRTWPYPRWSVTLPTASGMAALRAFAGSVEAMARAASGGRGEPGEAVRYESALAEVPLDGRVDVALAETRCRDVAAVRLSFASATKEFRRTVEVPAGADCGAVVIPVEGPFRPGQPIRGVLEVIPRAGRPVPDGVVERVAAYPARWTLFW